MLMSGSAFSLRRRRRSSIIDKLNRETNQALQTPDVRTRFAQWGLELEGGSPETFGAAIKAEVERIDQLVKAKTLQVQ